MESQRQVIEHVLTLGCIKLIHSAEEGLLVTYYEVIAEMIMKFDGGSYFGEGIVWQAEYLWSYS